MTAKRNEKRLDGNDDESGQMAGQGFEKSLERLEKIVEEMEDGSLNLEDMIKRFEEGQALVKFCSKKLNEVERKIEILVKKNGDVKAEPFEGEPEEDDPGEGKDGSPF